MRKHALFINLFVALFLAWTLVGPLQLVGAKPAAKAIFAVKNHTTNHTDTFNTLHDAVQAINENGSSGSPADMTLTINKDYTLTSADQGPLELALGEGKTLEIVGAGDTRIKLKNPLKQRHFIFGTNGIPFTVIIKNIEFMGADNPAKNAAAGGLFVGGSVTLKLKNCGFSQNQWDFGGAIHMQELSTLVADNCTFTKNYAITNARGGAIYLDQSKGSLTLNNCTFKENGAREGGAVFAQGNLLLALNGCTFEQNKAYIGGAIAAYRPASQQALPQEGARLSIKKSKFRKNTAHIGGAIYTMLKTNEISGSVFTDNVVINPFKPTDEYYKSFGWGGAIALMAPPDSPAWANDRSVNLTISGTSFKRNTAINGGALYINSKEFAKAEITGGSIFKKNKATVDGGAIFLEPTVEGPVVKTVDPAAYTNLKTAADTVFSGNTSANWYVPPTDASAFDNLKFESTSIDKRSGLPAGTKPHILNNYDINYHGAQPGPSGGSSGGSSGTIEPSPYLPDTGYREPPTVPGTTPSTSDESGKTEQAKNRDKVPNTGAAGTALPVALLILGGAAIVARRQLQRG